jgi:hypothetical protein
VFSEFQKFQYTSEQISSLMDNLVAQSNKGSFSLAEFAKAAPQIFSAYSAIGTAPENIKKANAALQIISAGTKSPQKAVAAFNSTMNELCDPAKQKDLRRLGIRTRDSAGNFRDFNDIMFEIAKKSENVRNADYINKIFSASSMQAIRSYISHGERMYESLTDLGDTSGQLQQQSARMADTLQSNIQNLQTAFHKFADSNLTKPLENLTGLLNKLAEDPERLQKVFTGIAVGIGSIAAVKGIAGISRLVGSLLQLKGGKIDIGGAMSMASAMPVYVTNWGGGAGIPGMGSGGQFQQTELAKKTPSTNAKNAVKNITPKQYGGAAAGAGVAAAFVKVPQMVSELGEIKQNEALTAKERGRAKGGAIGDATGSIVGAAAGGAAGIAAGAAVGAAVGSVVPVLGTAVGALVGAGIGAIGMYLGGKAGRKIGEGIGAATAGDEGSGEEGQVSRKRTHRPGYRNSSSRRIRQMPVSNLPPQITQTSSNIEPLKAELEGKAVMDVNVNLSGASPTAIVTVRDNTTPLKFNSGSAVQARMVQ